MRFLFIVNVPYFFLSHRSPVARAVAAAGHEVHVATGGGPTVAGIEAMGFAHHDLPLSRAGRNPLREIVAFWAMWRLLRRLKPDVVHLVSIQAGDLRRHHRPPGRGARRGGGDFGNGHGICRRGRARTAAAAGVATALPAGARAPQYKGDLPESG